jgi:ketosteroid isomerase-like protein
MSHQNVTLLRRANKAFNDGDLDAFLALVDDDVDATPRLARMEGSFRGHDGIRRWWQSVRDSFVYFYSEIVEVRDFGDLTLAEVHDRGHGVGSQAEVEQRSWHVTEWRDRKAVWWYAYGTEAEAVGAVRLRQ